MTHYRSLLDPGEFLGPQDFPKPTPRTICRVASERMKAREDAHHEHREHMAGQFDRLDASIRELTQKLDRFLGTRTPYPPTTRAGGE